MVGFNKFAKSFLTELSSPWFGDSSYERKERGHNQRSAAFKKLTASGAVELLRQRTLLKSAYALLEEGDRLAKEQWEVRKVSKKMRAIITQTRNAQKTLQSLTKSIQELEQRLTSTLSWQSLECLRDACRSLEDCHMRLQQTEEDAGSSLHPSENQKYRQSQWELLTKDFDYELATLRQKAPDQWLITQLNDLLRETFSRTRKRVPDVTRYRVIAALCRAADLGMTIEPSAIKQFFSQ